MNATTFDYDVVLRGNHAMPQAPGIDGKTMNPLIELNYSIIPVRPAGAAWSNVRDMLAFVEMELADGLLPDGQRYVSKESLLARRASQVPYGKNATYGMGLEVDTTYGIPVVTRATGSTSTSSGSSARPTTEKKSCPGEESGHRPRMVIRCRSLEGVRSQVEQVQ